MERFKKGLILLIAISIPFIFLHCTKYKEEAPFFDGLYLKYYEVFAKSQNPEDIIWTRDIVYRFKQTEDGNFHISQKVHTQKGKRWKLELELIPYPQVGDDLTIDKKGIVLKGGDGFMNFINGYPSSLWLPSDKRKEGDEVIEAIRKVEEKTRWKGWEVLPVKGMLGDRRYYDVNTGILVGVEYIKGLKTALIDTNLKVLKATLPKRVE